MKQRLYLYDNLKAFLIIAVVLFHTGTGAAEYYKYDDTYFKLILFFLIPLFIYTTGFFAKKSSRTPIKRFKKIFIVYLIAQILITIYYSLILNDIKFTLNIFVARFTLWYLLSCCLLYLSEYIIKKFKPKNTLIISIIIAILSGFVPFITDMFSLSRTICILPFFILGYYHDELNLDKIIKKYKKPAIILTIIITIIFFIFPHYFCWCDTYMKFNYYTYRKNIFFNCFNRCLMYIINIIYSIAIINLMTKNKNKFSNLGSQTLGIYLCHGVILKTLLQYKLFIGNQYIGTIIAFIIIFTLSFYLTKYYYIIKNKLLNKNHN